MKFRGIAVTLMIFGMPSCFHGGRLPDKPDSEFVSKKSALLDTVEDIKEFKFKRWVFDTLNSLAGKDSFKLSKDSMVLIVTHRYDIHIVPGRHVKDDDINSVISLLKEYREAPKHIYSLKFFVEFEYTPSPVPDVTYELYSYPDEIEVSSDTGRTRLQYDYIRGRLSGKTIKSADGKILKRIDFIWKGKSLMKVEV